MEDKHEDDQVNELNNQLINENPPASNRESESMNDSENTSEAQDISNGEANTLNGFDNVPDSQNETSASQIGKAKPRNPKKRLSLIIGAALIVFIAVVVAFNVFGGKTNEASVVCVTRG